MQTERGWTDVVVNILIYDLYAPSSYYYREIIFDIYIGYIWDNLGINP